MRTLRVAVAALVLLVSATAAHAQNAALGTWDLTTVSPQGETKSVVEIKMDGDALVAVGKSANGERKYDSIAVKGNDITLVITINFNGSPMTITYTGKIDGAKMAGDADYGGLATGTFSGAKK
jgi:hypothetical protein